MYAYILNHKFPTTLLNRSEVSSGYRYLTIAVWDALTGIVDLPEMKGPGHS